MGTAARAGVLLASAAVVLGGPVGLGPAGPAGAMPAAASLALSPAPMAVGDADDESGTPSPADLEAQQSRVRELEETARQTTDQLEAAEAQLQASSLQAASALESYSLATRAAVAADLAEQQARAELLQARLDAVEARRRLGEWARASYRSGQAPGTSSALLVTLLNGRPTDDVAVGVQIARSVGQSQVVQVRQLTDVEREEAETVRKAAQATAASEAAASAADAARRQRDDAVAARRAIVNDLQGRLDELHQQSASARDRVAKLTEQLQQARTASGGADPSCPGGDLTGQANGELATSMLCPLWQAPGQVLRADAAAAFNRLSQAYAQVFGKPICVTDSYRTYAQQVVLYATKPALAAVPGTSNHGWGTATDLCGGIQNFGTAEHDWLVLNAPGFGWFHPGWAQPRGSRPEPWHFEFGG